jgi:hypothetical protein
MSGMNVCLPLVLVRNKREEEVDRFISFLVEIFSTRCLFFFLILIVVRRGIVCLSRVYLSICELSPYSIYIRKMTYCLYIEDLSMVMNH